VLRGGENFRLRLVWSARSRVALLEHQGAFFSKRKNDVRRHVGKQSLLWIAKTCCIQELNGGTGRKDTSPTFNVSSGGTKLREKQGGSPGRKETISNGLGSRDLGRDGVRGTRTNEGSILSEGEGEITLTRRPSVQ